MANELKRIEMPSEVKSGRAVTATAVFKSAAPKELTIEAVTGGFSVSPRRVALPASSDGERSFELTVTRQGATTETCRLEFSAFGDLKVKRPWVS